MHSVTQGHKLLLLAIAGGFALASGCVVNKRGIPATTQTATDIDPAAAKGDYWYGQPPIASATNGDYRRLYDECEHSIRMRYFAVDRIEYRQGLVTSKPLISRQIWEFWRRDVGSTSQIVDSSLATYRRTIRWQIKQDGGLYVASPYVLVEHYIGEEDRTTIAANIRTAVSSGEALPQIQTPSLTAAGTSKWYAVGRDEALERQLAKDVQNRLQGR